MKKTVIIAVVSLVAGLARGFFVGRCCGCGNSCDTQQSPDAKEIQQMVEKEVAEQFAGTDSVEVSRVRVVTATPDNLQQVISEEVGKALKDAKQMYEKTKQQTDDK